MDKYIGFDIDCKKTATSLRPGVWPDFPASDFKFILAFEEIGFVWVCFFGPEGGFIFIILYNI